MPRPKGWSTHALNKRDKCVSDLKNKGAETSKAYAICTAMVQKTSNPKGK